MRGRYRSIRVAPLGLGKKKGEDQKRLGYRYRAEGRELKGREFLTMTSTRCEMVTTLEDGLSGRPGEREGEKAI